VRQIENLRALYEVELLILSTGARFWLKIPTYLLKQKITRKISKSVFSLSCEVCDMTKFDFSYITGQLVTVHENCFFIALLNALRGKHCYLCPCFGGHSIV